MAQKRISDEQIAKIKEAKKQGLSNVKAAKFAGVSTATVNNYCRAGAARNEKFKASKEGQEMSRFNNAMLMMRARSC